MTLDEIRAAVQRIADVAHDDEVAHDAEDALHHAVLKAIADGAPDAADLAREAPATREIDFARWCA